MKKTISVLCNHHSSLQGHHHNRNRFNTTAPYLTHMLWSPFIYRPDSGSNLWPVDCAECCPKLLN